ncbi:carbohydrate binding family 9 domain-containing protein [candidate division KSB1 bacterium]|nr:carbohydrate binding family 9 domain-containing protein [candidate division KSB1 bacterium]
MTIYFLWIGPLLAQTEGEMVKISVSSGMAPTFSWTPDIPIGRLVVEDAEKELWGTETEGTDTYRSPIRYGVHPPDAIEPEPANPLVAGQTYKVSLFRWINVANDEFQLVGAQEFTPTADPEGEEMPVAGIRPTLRAGALSSDFRFNGAMDGQAWWDGADAISNLITIEPEEGGAPEGRTVVKVLANSKEIVVGVRCFDNEPNGIVAFSKGRDVAFEDEYQEDHIVIVFDTFQDGRSGYVFSVNPVGARSDGLVIEQGEDVNGDWDTIWEAKTSRDDSGWSAEIRIPIKSLSFKKGLTEWGFNVQRRVERLQETSRWSSAKRDYDIYQTSRAGILTGLPNFDLGMGMSIRPALVGRGRTPEPQNTEYDGDLSLDMTQKLGPNLLSALTVNTDFAETEVDVRQINVTRFPVFFPEKRSFFLEGADIFEFGVGLDEDNLLPFFSRRIGLFGSAEEDQSPIPINAGGKINGRVGNTNLGALVANTRKVEEFAVTEDSTIEVEQATMGALRLKQNVLEESSLGMLATFGDQQGRSNSWSAGVDFTYRTSNFLNEKTLLIGVWGLLNNREDLAGDKSAYGLRIDYPNDLFDVNFTSIRIGPGFDPSLGFVPRRNIHLWDFTGDYKPRPNWSLVRQMTHEFSFRLFNTWNNSTWESYDMLITPLDWLFESGDQFKAGLLRQGDRPPEVFELASDVDIATGTYEWTRYFVEARSAQKRMISVGILWETGNYYNGDLNTIEGKLALKPSSFLTLEFTGERNTGKATAIDVEEEELTEVDFTEELFGARVLLNFSSNLQFSSLTQYDTQSRELGSNNKLRWTFSPLGDIFLVYNHNLIRRISDNRWKFVSNELPVKIQYAWRF